MPIFNKQLESAPKILEALLTAPSTGPGNGAFFTKDVGGVVEGFYVDSNGVEVQITSNGNLIFPTAGEANTASSLGTGEDIFKQKTGVNLEFRSIRGDGSTIAVSTIGDDIVISAPALGEDNTASNLPGGTGIFASKVGVDLQFKSLIAGTDITFVEGANTITINGSSSGEANTASNVGLGNELFKNKSGVDLRFRTLIAGTGITLTNSISGDEIVVAATGSSGSPITIRDEGSIVETSLTEINFTGTGVTASQTSPGVVSVAITSGGGPGTDELVKVSSNDTTGNYLLNKLVAGTNITLTENNNGGNETITISASGSSAPSITVEDEGTPLTTAVTKFNFVGAGVTVTEPVADEITVTIHGGGGGGGGGASVSDIAYAVSWNGDTATAPSKNAVYDKIVTMDSAISANTAKVSADGSINTHSDVTVTTPSNGQVLTYQSGQWINAASAGGGSIAVEDEGSEIVASAARINFTGAGVTASDAGGGEVTVTIAGGGSAAVEAAFITVPTGASLSARLAAATGVPAGWSLVLGNDGTVDSGLTTVGAAATDLVIVHGSGKSPGSVKVMKDFGGLVRQQVTYDPSTGDILEDNSYNQILLKDIESGTKAGTAEFHITVIIPL